MRIQRRPAPIIGIIESGVGFAGVSAAFVMGVIPGVPDVVTACWDALAVGVELPVDVVELMGFSAMSA